MKPEELADRLSDRVAPVRHLYLHLPFCERICPYCDFSTAVGAGADVPAFLNALETEVRLLGESGLTGRLDLDGGTLYLGGGTPSWFEPGVLIHLLRWLGEIAPGEWREATVEMNPEHADGERLDALQHGGITRISLGAQSLTPAVLRRLGRIHTPEQVRSSVAVARAAGFDISVDLIFAVPDQQMEDWRRDVTEVMALEPDHVSLYSLTYESGTPMDRWRQSGRVTPRDETWETEAYAWAVEALRSAGYRRYEISNLARPGAESVHNRAYWSGADYLGIGPSAHSLLAGVRTASTYDVRAWSDLIGEGRIPWESVEALDDLAVARERVLLGLRADRGVSLEEIPLQYRTGVEAAAEEVVERGLAEWTVRPRRLVLTDRGILLADELAVRIAP